NRCGSWNAGVGGQGQDLSTVVRVLSGLSAAQNRMERYREAAAPSGITSRFLPFVTLPPKKTTAKVVLQENADAAFRIDARACGHRVHHEPREKRGRLPVRTFVGAGVANERSGSAHAGRAEPRQSFGIVG